MGARWPATGCPLPQHVVAELLLRALVRYARSTRCDCLLLSGGVDTTLVALAARLAGLSPRAYTAYYAGGLPRDLPYAAYVARLLGLEHVVVGFDDGYVRSRAPLVVACTGRRDYVELRNDVATLRALEEAARDGCRCVYLGEGGDELLLGYAFHRLMGADELREAVLRHGVRGRYPGLELAECVGVEAHAPLLSDEVLELALAAVPLNAQPPGKNVARLVLSAHGLYLVAERPKTPAEAGAGTDALGRAELERLTGMALEEHA